MEEHNSVTISLVLLKHMGQARHPTSEKLTDIQFFRQYMRVASALFLLKLLFDGRLLPFGKNVPMLSVVIHILAARSIFFIRKIFASE